MLGGLYGDLPPPSSAPENSTATTTPTNPHNVWSTAAKMAPPTLRKHPLPTTVLKPKPKPHAPVYAPVQPGPAHSVHVAIPSNVNEEYDPARPNDYEDYRREKKRRAMEMEVERRRKIEEEERERREKEFEERQRDERVRDKEKNLNISGEEAWKRRQAMANPPRSPPEEPVGGDGFSIGRSETGGLGIGAGGNMSAAQRMMAKMGWKQGQGLGKQEQGITTPLVARKTDRRAGVIVNASEAKTENKPEKKVKSVNLNGVPTRVLLLRNMVGPGEVDDELEVEVAEECAKYGKVTRVLIFEITEQNFPSDEAVRIFVQFEKTEQTTKALIDLDGRFFGGRIVKAGFYEEDKFNKNELAPAPGEIPGF